MVAEQDDIGVLITRCAAGNRTAFSQLYRRTAAKLNGVIQRILPREAAEEALQESYVRIWQQASSFEAGVASPIAWMAAMARNQAIDLKRRGSERLSEASASDDELLFGIPAAESSTLASITLHRCLEELPPDRRELVLLACCLGLSREELAEHRRKPIATIKPALRQSLLVLKACLDGGETQEEPEGLAAEFVLGTLTEKESEDARFRVRTDPDFKRAVEAWNRRLAPLMIEAAPVEPPSGLEEEIFRRIAERRNAPDGVIGLQRLLRRWQRFSLAGAAIAAGLVVLLFGTLPRQIGAPAETSRYVAVLQADGQVAGFIADIDLDRGEISVKRAGAQPISGKSFELWAVGGSGEKPKSLGLVDKVLKIPATRLGGLNGKNLESTMLAISLEPEGGSPSGQPTGPLVFSGKLIATD
jgi:RNA polymerase sigma-70 factor (ECF subfamily)